MTGGGKTVAARRIIRELIGHRYPLLIFDPHGDYVGLSQCKDVLKTEAPGCDIKLFYPDLLIQKDGEDLVTKLISQMTSGLTEAQMSYLGGLFDRKPADQAEAALTYILRLLDTVEHDISNNSPPAGAGPSGNWKGTVGAVRRSLRIVQDKLGRMKKTSEQLRKSSKLRDLSFEPLPSPFSTPEKIIRPGQVSILYLGGYDHVTQCSIAAITLETLFEFRSNLTGRIAPFMTVIEEAHTFIPSSREGTHDAVSLPVVRRVITEGRKFGTGLILVSQRPSRLDETIVSQCNSFLILRLVNPRDQNFVRSVMENLTEADARMVPGFGPGQGIVSGQVVRFPLPVKVEMDHDLLASELGDEDFFQQSENWQPDDKTATRKRIGSAMATVRRNRLRNPSKKAEE